MPDAVPVDDLTLRYRLALRSGRMGMFDLDLGSGQAVWLDEVGIGAEGPSGPLRGSFAWFVNQVHPGDRERVATSIERAIARGEAAELEFRAQDAFGTRWLRVTADVLHADGRPVRLVGAVSDITDVKEREQRLVEASGLLEHIVSASDLVLYAGGVTEDGLELTYLSANVAEQLGYRPEELMGPGGWATIARPEDRRKLRDALATAGGDAVVSHEVRLRRGDGVDRWFRVALRVERGPDGAAVRFLGYAVDVTDRRAADEQLRRAQRLEAVGQLAGGIAHDFNNLLTAIMGFAELAATSLDEGSPARESIEASLTAARRAAGLVEQLLAFSRRRPASAAPVDLDGILAGMVDLLDRTSGARTTVTTALAGDLPVVTADVAQLEQMVLTLVVNARDAMPDGGTIVLATDVQEVDAAHAAALGVTPGRYVRVHVRDDGTGIDEAALPRIFEPYFTTKGEGSGLGLAMVHGTMSQAGGAASVTSATGEGTTITLWFPAAPQPVA